VYVHFTTLNLNFRNIYEPRTYMEKTETSISPRVCVASGSILHHGSMTQCSNSSLLIILQWCGQKEKSRIVTKKIFTLFTLRKRKCATWHSHGLKTIRTANCNLLSILGKLRCIINWRHVAVSLSYAIEKMTWGLCVADSCAPFHRRCFDY